jgi:hypothetical protein
MVALRNGLLTFAALYAGLTLAYMLYNSVTNPLGSIDLHSYWYAAHFLREGRDPYQAYVENATPTPPIVYGDGITVNDDPAQPNLQTVPVNTAPILLVMAPLAYLSWVPAKILWLGINTILMLIAPWLTLRLAQQHDIMLERWQQWAVAIAFFAIAAPRFAVGYGQTSLLVYDLMLGALLLYARHPIVTGLLFGVALSKYSLVFPVALLFLYRRQWRVLLTAGLVQVFGLLIINGIGGTSPLTTLQAYAVLAAEHTTKLGIHIGSLYNGSTLFRLLAPLALTVVVGGVGYRLRSFWKGAAGQVGQNASSVGEFSLIVIGLLWGLLVVYHRMYDGLLILPFLIWLVWGARRLAPPYSRWAQWYGIGIVTILAVPLPLYEWLFSSYWSKIFNSVWTLIFCSALAVAFALIRAEIQSGGRSNPNEGTIAGTGELGLRS